jgi:hypothetical protein
MTKDTETSLQVLRHQLALHSAALAYAAGDGDLETLGAAANRYAMAVAALRHLGAMAAAERKAER